MIWISRKKVRTLSYAMLLGWYNDRGWKIIIMQESFKITMCTLFNVSSLVFFYKHFVLCRRGTLYKQKKVLYIAFSFIYIYENLFFVCVLYSTTYIFIIILYFILFLREQTLCINNEVFELWECNVKNVQKMSCQDFLVLHLLLSFPFCFYSVCYNICICSCGNFLENLGQV